VDDKWATGGSEVLEGKKKVEIDLEEKGGLMDLSIGFLQQDKRVMWHWGITRILQQQCHTTINNKKRGIMGWRA
jgi:hypothetical protein